MMSSHCSVAAQELPAHHDQALLRPEAEGLHPNESLLLGAILGVTALLYAATRRFGFVNDDHSQIVNNVTVQSWHFVPSYFRGQVWDFLYPGMPGNYYCPLNFLLFCLNDALFGLHPAGWHAASVGLHLGVTTLIYRLARRLSGKTRVAAFTALLFAVHPMRHEVVGWVSGSTESLWSLMFLAAFLAYLKARDGRTVLWMVSSCGFFHAAALLSKEPAIMLPVIVFVHAWIYQTPESQRTSESEARRWLKAMTPAAIYVPVAIAYLVVRIKVLHGFSHSGNLPTKTFLFTLLQWRCFMSDSGSFRSICRHIMTSRLAAFNVVHVLLPVLGFAALSWLLGFGAEPGAAGSTVFRGVDVHLIASCSGPAQHS